jgi:hypothetical protein
LYYFSPCHLAAFFSSIPFCCFFILHIDKLVQCRFGATGNAATFRCFSAATKKIGQQGPAGALSVS